MQQTLRDIQALLEQQRLDLEEQIRSCEDKVRSNRIELERVLLAEEALKGASDPSAGRTNSGAIPDLPNPLLSGEAEEFRRWLPVSVSSYAFRGLRTMQAIHQYVETMTKGRATLEELRLVLVLGGCDHVIRARPQKKSVSAAATCGSKQGLFEYDSVAGIVSPRDQRDEK